MRVAFAITVYNSAKFLFKQFQYLHRLNPKPDIIYFIENNSKDNTLDFIIKNCKLPYKIIRVWFKEDAVDTCVKNGGTVYDTIAHARQLGLTAFRHDGCDYGIFLDDDIYPEDIDFITKITRYELTCDSDIIGGTYERIYPEGLYVASKWGTGYAGKFKLKKYNEVQKPFDMPRVTSGGCMVLSKRIIQDRRLNFYPIYPKYQASEDYGYCLSARELGYKIILDNTAKLYHEYMRTIRNIKPWTMGKDKQYMKFKY